VEADRRRAREAQLTAARLETELLKKNIQPHFLLNTLATIVEVIEQEPKTAVALIEALAGEFRILARVAGEKLVPLGHELDLCRAHLGVMSRRKGARCSLAVHGVDERALVPPALFHTLVENGLTHLLPSGGEQRFELHADRVAEQVRYTLVAWGQAVEAAPPQEETRREGTGLRYVKARLEESFPGRWTMTAGPVEGGWRTVIVLHGPPPEGGLP
jgi:LytS/YehU family sensor histidine kinase